MKWGSGPGMRRLSAPALIAAALVLATMDMRAARAEFGDVVMNQYSDAAGVRPVVFPHWFHRVRYSCKACHSDLGIKYKAGGNGIMMLKIIDGLYCGACHNGTVAWSVEQCDLCHSGRPGMPTQVHESTVLQTGTPSAAGKRK